MGKIYISTNRNQPKNLYTSDKDKTKLTAFMETNGFINGVRDNVKEVFANVFLISDELDLLPPNITIDRKSDYLLYHKDTKQTVKEGFDFAQEGHHVIGKKFKYEDVFVILFDDSIQPDNKAKQIIEFLFPKADTILGKKLDLLHNLLVPPADFAEANKQWEEIETTIESARASGIIVSLATNEDALTTFQNAVNGINDPFDPEYIKALAKLRDDILLS